MKFDDDIEVDKMFNLHNIVNLILYSSSFKIYAILKLEPKLSKHKGNGVLSPKP